MFKRFQKATKARPADFDSPKYKPCGMNRIVFKERALSEVNTVFLIDDSYSMVMKEFQQEGKPLNWDVMTNVAPLLFDIIAQNDADGACLYFLHHMSELCDEPGVEGDGLATTGWNQIQNPKFMMDRMKDARPHRGQGTPTGERIKHITDAYLKRCADKTRPRPRPMSLIVWTDGGSNNDEYLKRVIQGICRELQRLGLPKGQIGIQFFQVGDIEGVEEVLDALDNKLKGKDGVLDSNGQYWDIVDTRKQSDIEREGGFNVEALIRLVLGSFVKQIDMMDKFGNAPDAAPGDEFTL